MTGESVCDSDFLFRLTFNREEEKRSAQRGQLESRGTATLDNGQIAHREVLIELRDHTAEFWALGDCERGRVDAGAAHEKHSHTRETFQKTRISLTAELEKGASYRGAPNRANHEGFRPISQGRTKSHSIIDITEVEAKRVADELHMAPGVISAVRQKDPEGTTGDIVYLTEKDGTITSTAGDPSLLGPYEIETPSAEFFERAGCRDVHAVEVVHHDEGSLSGNHVHSEDIGNDNLVSLIANNHIEVIPPRRLSQYPGVMKPASQCPINVPREVQPASVSRCLGLVRLTPIVPALGDKQLPVPGEFMRGGWACKPLKVRVRYE